MLFSRSLSDFQLISFFTSFLTKAQILSKATKMQFYALKLGLHEISHRACDGSHFLMAACAIKRGAFYVSRPDSKASEQKEMYSGAANIDRILVTKGQLISKANCQAVSSSKNEQMNSFLLLWDIFSFFLWKKLKTPTRHFEII